MLRFLLRRLPRFGFLTLFGAMLLFVSGAGWLKFRFDEHREEQAILAALAKENCQVSFRRAGDEEAGAEESDDAAGSHRFFRPIEELSILYLWPDTKALVDRAARLPHLKELRAQQMPSRYSAPPPQVAELIEVWPIQAPAPSEVPLPEIDEPLPMGKRLTLEEVESLLRSWSGAWSEPTPQPNTYVALEIDLDDGYPRETIEIVGTGGRLKTHENAMVVGDGRHVSEFYLYPHGLVECSRCVAEEDFAEVALSVESNSTGRGRLEKALEKLEANDLLSDLSSERGRESIDRMGRTDDGFVRIDFAPRQFVRRDVDVDSRYAVKDTIRLSILLRPEREYPVDAFDLDVVRDGARGRSTESFALRGVSSLHGDRYRFDAVSLRVPLMGARPPAPGVPSLTPYADASRFAYDFDAKIPPQTFDPATYGAIEFAEPRELPVWRWYRATFAVSLAIFGFVAVRKVAGGFRRSADSLPSGPASDERDEAAFDATTGP